MAAIIKANTARPAAFNFADMGDKANAYLGEVRTQASEIISQARAEAEVIKQQAQAEGRQAALKAAEAAIQTKLDEQFKQLVPALESAAQQLLRSKEEWQRQWEQNLIRLATKIAERVIRREIASDLEIPATLHLHPADRAALGERVQQLAARMSKLGPVQVVSDETVTRGGCRVHTEFGVIDQQVEEQLKRIETELS